MWPLPSANCREWSMADCLGQMAMTESQAVAYRELFDLLPEEALAWLQVAP